MGKQLVNLLQVVKRTNSFTNGVVDRQWVFGSWVRTPLSTTTNVYDFPHVELEKYSPRCTHEMKPLGCLHVRPYIRPTCYPAVSGGEIVVRFRLGKQLVDLLQVVKRTNTSLVS